MTWAEIVEAQSKGTWLFWPHTGELVRVDLGADYRVSKHNHLVWVSFDNECFAANAGSLRTATAQDLLR